MNYLRIKSISLLLITVLNTLVFTAIVQTEPIKISGEKKIFELG